MRKIIGWLLLLMTPLSVASQDGPVHDLRLYGVRIKVTDMDRALHFYGEVLGFAIRSRADYPATVTLDNDGIALVLSQTQRNTRITYPGSEQTMITFQANDLASTVARLRARGVKFLFDKPQRVGIGIANKFQDPFGNTHSLLEQQVGETPVFVEPRIYNVGYIVADMGSARRFYDRLGFVVRTEAYYPPALPLGHRDGSFAFMLHLVPDARNRGIDYEQEAQVLLLFAAGDLSRFIRMATKEAIPLIQARPKQTPLGRMIAFRNPAGLAAEIIEMDNAAPGSP